MSLEIKAYVNVLSLSEGQDGELNATYDVYYEKEKYIVDHLVEDYIAGQVKFIAI